MGSPYTPPKPPVVEDYTYKTTDLDSFPNWFDKNVSESVLEYDSGIKMHTWMGMPEEAEVIFGTDNRFHFSVKLPTGEDSTVTLFDGTNVGMYQRSVIRSKDRITIVYIPENLLTINYFGNNEPGKD